MKWLLLLCLVLAGCSQPTTSSSGGGNPVVTPPSTATFDGIWYGQYGEEIYLGLDAGSTAANGKGSGGGGNAGTFGFEYNATTFVYRNGGAIRYNYTLTKDTLTLQRFSDDMNIMLARNLASGTYTRVKPPTPVVPSTATFNGTWYAPDGEEIYLGLDAGSTAANGKGSGSGGNAGTFGFEYNATTFVYRNGRGLRYNYTSTKDTLTLQRFSDDMNIMLARNLASGTYTRSK